MSRLNAVTSSPLGAQQSSFFGGKGFSSVLVISTYVPNLSKNKSGEQLIFGEPTLDAIYNCYRFGSYFNKVLDGGVYKYFPVNVFGNDGFVAGTVPLYYTGGPQVEYANPSSNLENVNLDGFRLIIFTGGKNHPTTIASLLGNGVFNAKLKTWLHAGGRLLIHGESNIYPGDSNMYNIPITINNITLSDKVVLNTWLGGLGCTMQLGGGCYLVTNSVYCDPSTAGGCPPNPGLSIRTPCETQLDLCIFEDDTPSSGYPPTDPASPPPYSTAWPGVGVSPVPAQVGQFGFPSGGSLFYWDYNTVPQSLYGCNSANIHLGSGKAFYCTGQAFFCHGCTFDSVIYDIDDSLADRVEPGNCCVMGIEKVGSGYVFLSGDCDIFAVYNSVDGNQLPTLPWTLTNRNFFRSVFWMHKDTLDQSYAMLQNNPCVFTWPPT